MADNFKFELVSPERLLLSETVTEVVIPATEGEMTVMANHAPMMTTIKPGVVTVKSAAGQTTQYVVFGGFADILPSGCTLLAESAVAMDDVNRDTLQKRIEKARHEIDAAHSHEHKTKLEQYLMELTNLHSDLPA
jgi:F-type H+-transporting ATPase subunit epsilon